MAFTVSSGQILSGEALSGDASTSDSGTVMSGGILIGSRLLGYSDLAVSGGGSALRTVLVGPDDTVEAGGLVSGINVGGWDLLSVSAGGTAVAATLSGAYTASAVIGSGGSGSAFVVDEGTVTAAAGGTLSGVTAAGSDYRQANVDVAGTASDAVIGASGHLFVETGGTASGLVVSGGGEVRVSGGGTVSVLTLGSGGSGGIAPSGAAVGLTVGSGAAFALSSGATVTGNTVMAGGQETLAAGVVISDFQAAANSLVLSGIVVSSGATLTVSGPVPAISAAVFTATAAAASILDAVLVLSGGSIAVSAGGSTSATVLSGGAETISAGGDARATQVRAGGTQSVSSGGSAISATIGSGGSQTVFSGGTANFTGLGSFATGTVLDGGVASTTSVGAYSTETVSAGGVATGASVGLLGGLVVASGGRIVSTTLSGGAAAVQAGGIASATTLGFQGGLSVMPGGSAAGIAANVDAPIFMPGYTLDVAGTANTISLAGFGGFTVEAGGTATAVALGPTSGGSSGVSATDSGTISGITVGAASYLQVAPGARVVGLAASGGYLYSPLPATVMDFGSISGAQLATLLLGSATLTVAAGGAASGVGVGNHTREVILAGGTDRFAQVSGGGEQDVYGFASGATVSAIGFGQALIGTQAVESGGEAVGTVLSGALVTNFGSGVAPAIQTVLPGGAASNTRATQFGLLEVDSGGQVANATIQGEGALTVSAGGLAIGTLLSGAVATSDGDLGGWETVFGVDRDARVLDNSAQLVALGGVASGANVSGGALQFLTNGGAAVGTEVDSGGAEVVDGGAVASGALLAGGLMAVVEGGSAKGGIAFAAGASSELLIYGTVMPSVILSGFAPGDTIELASLPASLTYDSVTHVATLPDGQTLTFDPATAPATLRYDAATGAITACFAEGTRIATLRGDVPVENLVVGECVVGPWGEAMPIRWLGHRRVECRRHPRPRDVWPVRVRAHAFRPGAPSRDLLLSPDHAVFVAPPGLRPVLIPVRFFIDGDSVVQLRRARITYWHVELERHAVLLAESLPCESYLDTGNRAAFENGGAAVQLHPDFAAAQWERRACAPQARGGPALDWARRWLAARRSDSAASARQVRSSSWR